jgi:hypothetical protein
MNRPALGVRFIEDSTLGSDGLQAEVGKVTLKSNGNEALSDESLLKSNGNEPLNDNFS